MPFQGRIDQGGYTPPPAVIVHWSNGAQKPLDTSKPFAGWHDSDIPRYGGGDQSLAPHHPSAVGVEQRGGEAFAILAHLFEQAGVGRPPTEQETSDFAIVHGGRRVLGRGDWPALAGVESPVREGALGTARNPIIVNDPRFPKNHIRRIAGKVYMNDLDAKDAGPFPEEPAEPALPPKSPSPPPAPPVQPSPPAAVVIQEIDYRFDKREDIVLPPGAKSVSFQGHLRLGGPVADKTRSSIISTKLGPKPKKKGQRRRDAGTAVVNAQGGLALEANKKTEPASGALLPVGTAVVFDYEWIAGEGSRVIAGARTAEINFNANADQGGMIFLGVEQVDDPEADYVLLPEGSFLKGKLTITLRDAVPGSIVPPVPRPLEGDLRAMAAEVAVKSRDAANAAQALLAAIERRGS